MTHHPLTDKISLLPDLPGCYLMKDHSGIILYVGKAKNLKNRVRSYFRGAHDTKTQQLVAEIADFETIITATEKESLLLEISLIKKHQPKYNIRLKQGTMYPYLKITNERHPKMVITSTVAKDGGHYFGPYPNVNAANETLQLLHKIYPLRRCGRNEKRACFYYHLNQCIGCCDHTVTPQEYALQIAKIKRFLNGDISEIKRDLTEKMQRAAAQLAFEQAADYRNQIHHLDITVEKQRVIAKEYTNHDLFAYHVSRSWLSIQTFLLRQSRIIKREAAVFPCYGDPQEEVLSYIMQFYQTHNHPLPKELIVPHTIEADLLAHSLGCHVHVPQRGKKRSLLELAQKNCELALAEQFRLTEQRQQRTVSANDELAQALGLPQLHVIEAFDHSHIQGAHPVSAMVVYVDGQPQRKRYRKYHVKTVQGAHEFATTQEVIRRRYIRLIKEQATLPDLILMDGGAIQVQAARDVLEDELGLSIPVAGMVKDDKHRTATLIFGTPLQTVFLEPTSNAFHLVQRIQEEVHRFAITFHRQVRSKNAFASVLDDIPGVGPRTRQRLLQHAKNTTEIARMSLADLQQLGINKRTATQIVAFFQQNDPKS